MAEGVADVRLNRPDKMNALDHAMFEALVEAGDALAARPAVRAVVLSGEGRGSAPASTSRASWRWRRRRAAAAAAARC